MSMSQAELLDAIKGIAREAGERILDIYQRPIDVEHKDDRSPLTAADLASHRHIVSALEALTPDCPVLSEESAAQVPTAERLSWRRFWLVDPLDGTKEFIKRNGEFTVNIALVEEHYPVMGVVHVPAQNVTYCGAAGLGATREVDGQEPEPVRVRSLRPGQPVAVVGSRSHAGPHLQSYLQAIGECELVPKGSSLKLCLVAEGSADLYPRLGPTSEWDTAAAQAVVEAAGGRVVDLRGQRLRCNRGESVLNPYFLVYGDLSRDWLQPLPAEALEA
jgi:3'(2'), 5'-bisphosphate nucleotidase